MCEYFLVLRLLLQREGDHPKESEKIDAKCKFYLSDRLMTVKHRDAHVSFRFEHLVPTQVHANV